MKKILLAMAAFFGCATVSFAQDNHIATLQHEGTFSHYYGADALKNAYEAAANGDTITLSPGTFNSPKTINKPITLRGTGIDASSKTYVWGSVTFCSTDSTWVTTVEGIVFDGEHYDYCYFENNASGGNKGQGEIKMIKNKFYKVRFTRSSDSFSRKGPKVRIYNCDMFSSGEFYFDDSSYPDVFVYNSVVFNPYSSSYMEATTSAFVNCQIIDNYNYINNARYLNFYNCIIDASNYSKSFPNSATCNNCLSLGDTSLFSNLISGSNNWKSSSSDGIFSNGYELTEEAKATYIGLDGTQIGIYERIPQEIKDV